MCEWIMLQWFLKMMSDVCYWIPVLQPVPATGGPVRSKILDRSVKTTFSKAARQEYFSHIVSIF